MLLSTQIQRLRKQKNLSQSQLAQVLSISPSTLGMYEQGRRVPSLETIIILSEFFHVSLDYLVTGAESPHSAPAEDLRIPENCPCSTCFWKEYVKR